MPSSNHDMAQISYQLDEETDASTWIIYGFPGAPFLYYGDEIGMRYIPDMISVEGGYERTGSRTPMQWSKGVNGDFSSAPSGCYIWRWIRTPTVRTRKARWRRKTAYITGSAADRTQKSVSLLWK